MKDIKIRILSLVTAGLSLLCVIAIVFPLYEVESWEVIGQTYTYTVWGFELYSDPESWWMILVGSLGLIALLWNLVYGAYAAIDGRYRNLTWKIARYGYFYGAVVGLLNFAIMLSYAFNGLTMLPMWYVYIILLAAVVTLDIILIIIKDEETKNARA